MCGRYATVDHLSLVHIVQALGRNGRTGHSNWTSETRLAFFSENADQVALLLGMPMSRFSSASNGAFLLLESELGTEADVNVQVAQLLSGATDDLEAWAEVVSEHSASLDISIRALDGLCMPQLVEEIVAAIAERHLGICLDIDVD